MKVNLSSVLDANKSRLNKPFLWTSAVISGLLAGSIASDLKGLVLVLGCGTFFGMTYWLLVKPVLALSVFLSVWGTTQFLLNEIVLFQLSSVSMTLSRTMGVLLILSLGAKLVFSVIKHVVQIGNWLSIETGFWGFTAFMISSALTLIFWQGEDALSAFIRLLSGFVIFLTISLLVKNEAELLLFAKLATLSGALTGIFTTVTYILAKYTSLPVLDTLLRSTQGDTALRAGGNLGGPMKTAGFLLVCFGFGLLAFEVAKTQRARLFYLILNLIMGIGLLTTLTRSSLIGLLAALFVYLFWTKKSSLQMLGIMSLVLGVLLAGVFMVGWDSVIARMSDVNAIGSSADLSMAGSGRILLWQSNLAAFWGGDLFSKVFGNGLSSTPSLVWLYSNSITDNVTHNDYLEILVSNGLAGLLSYLVFVGSIIRVVLKAKRRQGITGLLGRTLGPVLLVYLCIQSNLDSTVYTTNHRWYFLAATAALFASLNPSWNKEHGNRL